jgi:plastocyanin
MRKTQIMGVLLIITVLVLGACDTTTWTLSFEIVAVTPPPETTTVTSSVITVTPTPTPTPTQGTYEVWEYDNFFSPLFITVPMGTTVTWTNMGYELHTVMSNTGLFDVDLAPGDSFSYTFTEPGRYRYHCHIHIDNMTGTVTVE